MSRYFGRYYSLFHQALLSTFSFCYLAVVSGGHLCSYTCNSSYSFLLLSWLVLFTNAFAKTAELAKVVFLLTLAHPELCSKKTEMFECYIHANVCTLRWNIYYVCTTFVTLILFQKCVSEYMFNSRIVKHSF